MGEDADLEAPSPQELAAYLAGRLEPARFQVVDRWIAARPVAEQEQLLALGATPGGLAGAAELLGEAAGGSFQSDPHGGRRYRAVAPLGAGGMGLVELVHDDVLGREVVLKRSRPRRPEEPIAAYLRRQQLFQREARLTAQLEHPGIVPVHDVGAGPLGEPSFTMKRLEGEPLSALIARRRAGARLDLAQAVEVLLKVADAVGYAHRRGIVHRDLKPENIIVGALGAVYVIDWGLAGAIGAGAAGVGGMGTPAWMAPEQAAAVAADPRMDVFAIGALLMAMLTGRGPRDGAAPAGGIDLVPLERARVPRALVAVALRCLQADAAARYADATAVADELRQWLAAGLTSAANPGRLARLAFTLRRAPRLSAALIGLAVALACLGVALLVARWHTRAQARTELEAIARTTPPSDLERLRQAHAQVLDMLARLGELPEGRALEVSLGTQIADREASLAQDRLERRLQDLEQAARVRAPYPGEITELAAAAHACGLTLTATTLARDAAVVRASPLRAPMLSLLARLDAAEVVAGRASVLQTLVPRLIADAAPDDAWRALARLLERPQIAGHDLAVPDRALALAAVAQSPVCADLVLALFTPQEVPEAPGARVSPSLRPLWEARLRDDPGAFWPRIAAGRAALAIPDYHVVEHHALIALGTEPASIWPHLLLGYTELARLQWSNLLTLAVEGLSVDPLHAELQVLRLDALAGLGQRAEAQAELNEDADLAALLRWHRSHPSGHPLELGIAALDRAHLAVPPGEARWLPLVPPETSAPATAATLTPLPTR